LKRGSAQLRHKGRDSGVDICSGDRKKNSALPCSRVPNVRFVLSQYNRQNDHEIPKTDPTREALHRPRVTQLNNTNLQCFPTIKGDTFPPSPLIKSSLEFTNYFRFRKFSKRNNLSLLHLKKISTLHGGKRPKCLDVRRKHNGIEFSPPVQGEKKGFFPDFFRKEVVMT